MSVVPGHRMGLAEERVAVLVLQWRSGDQSSAWSRKRFIARIGCDDAGMAGASKGKTQKQFELDKLDLSIIAQLQKDGRRAYGRIGEAVGLSEAGVRQRVQRLMEQEAVKIVAVTNPDLLGLRMRATIGIETEGPITPIADAVGEIEEVDYVVITAGSFTILVEVQCRNDAHLLSVLESQIVTIPGVRRTETFVYLRLSKQTYPWPPTETLPA